MTILQNMQERELVRLSMRQLPYVTDAYTELVTRYEECVFALCYRYLSTKDLAEDASQDVFIKVFHALPKFEYRSEFKTWLFSIAINHCNSLLAKLQREKIRHSMIEDFDQLAADEREDTASCVAKEDDKACVHEVIEALEGADRDLILLRFNSDLALQEIADVMDRKLSATKMKFYRALDKFKELYQKICT